MKKGQEVKIMGNNMSTEGYIHRFKLMHYDSENPYYSLILHNCINFHFKEIEEFKDGEGVFKTDTGYVIAIQETIF